MLRTRLTALALILSASLAHAGIENAGTTSGNFLSVGTGAGILSMGGATLGAGRDLNAAAWNPAALGYLASSEYAISHAALALDVSQDWVAASGRVGRSATRWSANALYQSDGSFDGRDAFGAPTGSFSVSNLALGLGLAQAFSPDVTAGARVQVLHESLGPASGSGLGVDLGLQARRGAFGFGAAARNLGGKMKYDTGSYDLPAVYGLGASWSDETRGLRFALDANFPRAYYNDVRFGGEWTWQQRVALRAGYRLELGAQGGEPLGGPSFGLGTGVNGFWFDYAFLAGETQAQGAHRFGVTFHPSFFQQRGLAPRADASASSASSAPVAASEPGPAEPATARKSEPVAAKSEPVQAPAPVAVKSEPVAAPAPVAVKSEPVAAPAPSSVKSEAIVAPTPVATKSAPVAVAPATPPAKSAPVAVAPAPAPVKSAPVAMTPAPAPVKSAPVAVAPAPAPVKSAPVAVAPAPAPAVVPAKPRASAKSPAPAPSQPAPVASVTPPAPAPAPPAAAPAPAPTADAPAGTPSPAIAKVAATPAPTIVVVRPAPAPPRAASAPSRPRPATVTVKKNETLADIASQWGTSVAAIMMENNLVQAKVRPGQKLKLPKS